MEAPRKPALWAQQQAMALVVLEHAQEKGELTPQEAEVVFTSLLETIREDYASWSNDSPLELMLSFVLLYDISVYLRAQDDQGGRKTSGPAFIDLLDSLTPPFPKSLVNDALALVEAYYHRAHEVQVPREVFFGMTEDYSEEEQEELLHLLSFYYRFMLKVFLPYHDSGDSVGHYLQAFCRTITEAVATSS